MVTSYNQIAVVGLGEAVCGLPAGMRNSPFPNNIAFSIYAQYKKILIVAVTGPGVTKDSNIPITYATHARDPSEILGVVAPCP